MITLPSGVFMIFSLLSGVLGLVVGSFLNVVVYRVPKGLSIVYPPSSCPHCGIRIRPFDNIPVLSWLILRGECRTCNTAISTRYPLVESGTALFFGVVAWGILAGWLPAGSFGADFGSVVGTMLALVAFLYLAAVSVALALIDLDVHRLPNVIVLPSYLVGAGLLTAAAITQEDLASLVRAGVGLAVLWTVYFLLALAYPGGMGFGDVKLSGVLGLYLGFLGWGELAVGAFAAFLLGGVYAVALLVSRRATRKSGIPFGPWMLVGAWVGIFIGGQVWDGYLTLLGAV